MVRTATPKSIEAEPGSLRYMHNDFNWGHIPPKWTMLRTKVLIKCILLLTVIVVVT